MLQIVSKFVLLLGILHFVTSHSQRRNPGGRSRQYRKNNRVCPLPVPDTSFDFQWVNANQPENGFINEFGNDVARLYIAQVLQEKLLSQDEDFSQLCSRLKLTITEKANTTVVNGSKFGYDDKRSDFNCTLTRRYPGSFQCHYLNEVIGRLEYTYPTLAKKNFIVDVICAPDGRRGWYTVSNASLSDDDIKLVLDHVESIGFNRHFVSLFDTKKCPTGPKQI